MPKALSPSLLSDPKWVKSHPHAADLLTQAVAMGSGQTQPPTDTAVIQAIPKDTPINAPDPKPVTDDNHPKALSPSLLSDPEWVKSHPHAADLLSQTVATVPDNAQSATDTTIPPPKSKAKTPNNNPKELSIDLLSIPGWIAAHPDKADKLKVDHADDQGWANQINGQNENNRTESPIVATPSDPALLQAEKTGVQSLTDNFSTLDTDHDNFLSDTEISASPNADPTFLVQTQKYMRGLIYAHIDPGNAAYSSFSKADLEQISTDLGTNASLDQLAKYYLNITKQNPEYDGDPFIEDSINIVSH